MSQDELPETPLDLSEYKTAHGAAKALGRFLREMYDAGDEVSVCGPERTKELRDVRADKPWLVSWEGGPFEWPIWLMGGESLGYGEHPELRSGDPSPEVVGWYGGDWHAEPYYKFDVVFYPE